MPGRSGAPRRQRRATGGAGAPAVTGSSRCRITISCSCALQVFKDRIAGRGGMRGDRRGPRSGREAGRTGDLTGTMGPCSIEISSKTVSALLSRHDATASRAAHPAEQTLAGPRAHPSHNAAARPVGNPQRSHPLIRCQRTPARVGFIWWRSPRWVGVNDRLGGNRSSIHVGTDRMRPSALLRPVAPSHVPRSARPTRLHRATSGTPRLNGGKGLADRLGEARKGSPIVRSRQADSRCSGRASGIIV
jgi:hypothetical protein